MSIRALPFDLRKIAENELNEIPGRAEEDLYHIRTWLSQQPHLTVKTDDQWLLAFLRGCKFSLQRTKEKLDMFYTMRTLVPEFFADRDPLNQEIQEVLKLGLVLPLPNTTDPTQPRTIYVRCEPADPTKIQLLNVIKTFVMIVDILMNEDDSFVIAGTQLLLDMKGAGINHLTQITPSICRKTALCMQDSYPLRPKSIYSLNTPVGVEAVLSLIKSLANDKFKKMVNIYRDGNCDNIYKDIPRSVLPKEYGGENYSLEELADYWKEKVEHYRNWFLIEGKNCSNENLRQGKARAPEEFLGIAGSFRKLNVD